MELLELPSEILIVILESFTDVRDLHALTQTCTHAQELYIRNSWSVIDSIVINSYPTLAPIVFDTLSAIRSLGELNYVFVGDQQIEWLVPEAHRISSQRGRDSLSLLKTLADLVSRTEDLADWCAPKCLQKATWRREASKPIRQSVLEIVLHLQLVTSRLYNVRIPSFPEHISLREHEKQHALSLEAENKDRAKPETSKIRLTGPPSSSTAMRRRTRDQIRDLMTEQLRKQDVHGLHNMWLLMQVLQDEYTLLQRHRLKPSPGSLLDLLFQHESGAHAWRINPWDTIQMLLREHGVHVISARPGLIYQSIGIKLGHALQQKDLLDFDRYVASKAHPGRSDMSTLEDCEICIASPNAYISCPHDYLEQLRPLLGLSFCGAIPIKYMARFPESMMPVLITDRYRPYEGDPMFGQCALGKMLWECAERNRIILAKKWRRSLNIDP